MDRHGIALAILSLNAPGIQAIPDSDAAIATAQRANNRLADAVRARPDRFAGFAALPMQDPDAAAAELTRCVTELGFKGALVNGFSEVGRVRPGRLLRRSGLRAVLGGRRTAERAVLSASARSAAGAGTDLRRPSVAARSGVGIRRRNRRARAAPDEQRPLRPSSAAHDHPRPPRRRVAVQHLAHRSPPRQIVAGDAGAAEAGGVSPLEFLSDDERQFSYADTRQRDGGGRRRIDCCSRSITRSRTTSMRRRGSMPREISEADRLKIGRTNATALFGL